VGSLVRIPVAVKAVKVPVIAAGGIADAYGFVAALALGAEGVLMGTRFMASKECDIHPSMKVWLTELGETDTMVILGSIGNAMRVIINEHTEKLREMEEKGTSLEELLPVIRGELGLEAYRSGDRNMALVSIGQSVGLIHDVLSVKEIIDSVISEAKTIVQRLNIMMNQS
jgi:nitronate monooxygenase